MLERIDLRGVAAPYMVRRAHLRKVPYDPADLMPVAKISGSYGMAVARKDLPADDFKEMVELAKKSPGKLTFGSAGTATITQLTGEIVNQVTGIETLHVPYKGSAPALTDLIGGQIASAGIKTE